MPVERKSREPDGGLAKDGNAAQTPANLRGEWVPGSQARPGWVKDVLMRKIVVCWRWLVQHPVEVLRLAVFVLVLNGYLPSELPYEWMIGQLVPFVQRLDDRRTKKIEERKEERKQE